MANDVLNINIESKIKSKSKSTNVSSAQKKDSPSLFDQMLSKNASKNKENKVSIKNTDNSNVKEKQTVSSKVEQKQIPKIIQNESKISLFDKLKSTSKETKTNNIPKQKVDVEKTTTKKSEVKVSLFDKLKSTSKETKTNNIPKQKVDIEKSVDLKEEKTTTKKSEVKVSLFDKLKSTSKETKTNNIPKQKVDVEKSVDLKEEKTTTKKSEVKVSLFDKLKSTSKETKNKTDDTILKTDNSKQNIIVGDVVLDINIKTEDTKNKSEKIKVKNNTNKKSLLDNLVNNIKQNKLTKKENLELNTEDKIQIKDKLNAKTFLSNQNTKATIISKQHIEKSKNILLDESTKDAKSKIINSAKTLELGAKSVELVSEEKSIVDIKNINKIDSKVQEQNTFLNKVLFKQALNMQHNNTIQNIQIDKKINELENSSKEIKTEDIQVKENSAQTAIQNITNKIISARQNMKSFMSDIARKMYENYKPPVTAFKINLNPAHLGSISITLKSEKSTNSISISMSASQGSTLEVLEGAKSLLQNSLQKTFDSQNSFSLDFSQQDNQSNMQDNQNNKQSKKDKSNANEELEEIIENDISINDGYM